jgi:uncharacterized membrane protein YqgA involved in biofilm formation
MLLGSIVNLITILIGGTLGTILGKGISERIRDAMVNGIGLCVLLIGITGALKAESMVLVIASIVIGGFAGELIRIDKGLDWLGAKIAQRFNRKNGEKTNVAQGFVSAGLIFAVGAMAVMGAMESGLTGNHETLYSKSLLDGITALSIAPSLGIGVALSGILVFVYQGSITLLSGFIQPFFTQAVIADMTSVGSLLIIATATNMLGITKIKVVNYTPAILIPVCYSFLIRII